MTARWRSLLPARSGTRDITTVDDYALAVSGYGGMSYGLSSGVLPGLPVTGTYGQQRTELVANTLEGYARLFGRNSVIYSCMAVRMQVFSTIRFQFQRINRGRPSELFGSASLAALEQPWVGGTTQDLLTRLIQDADLAGNAYVVALDGELVRLRPDWVQLALLPRMVAGMPRTDGGFGPAQVGWRKVGVVYYEGGIGASEPAVFLPGEVAHFAPIPDPLASYRGMSWLTPVVREAQNDGNMETHRSKFFENAATPNMAVSLDKEIRFEAFKRFVDKMELDHRGVENAYRTLYLGGGADVTVIGADFKQMDFSAVQGHAETRIAAAAGVPPVIVGLSEGLQAATYSNYAQARRRLADGTMHPLWANVAGSLQVLVPPPSGTSSSDGSARLWYDARDVAFLREDRRDAVDILQVQASTVRSLIEAGYDPDAAVAMVSAEDLGLLLGKHSGLTSVQLQPPVDPNAAAAGDAPAVGDGADAAAGDPDAQLGGTDTPDSIRLMTEMIQKVYLGVGKMITAREARALVNRAGANLGELPDDSPLVTPTEPPSGDGEPGDPPDGGDESGDTPDA